MLEKVFNIGDLVTVVSTDPFSGDDIVVSDECALIVDLKEANEGSGLKYFYKLQFCTKETAEEQWLFSNELALISEEV